MRVLIVISGLGLGGAERQVVLLSRELVRLGHRVSIYTLTREVPRLDELQGTGVDVTVDQKRLRLDVCVLRRLRRHLLSWRPDIVHGFLYDGDIYSRIAALGTGLPVLNSERNDNYVLSWLQRVGYRLTAKLCNGIIANSHAGADFARRTHRILADHVHVVWNGIDVDEIDARLGNSSRPAELIFPGAALKRICLVGSIKPQKDYLLALQVARCLIDKDHSWRLICVGDMLSESESGYKAQILAHRDRLRLGSFVSFVGHRRDVPEIIGSCDVLLVTSVHEGFPNVVLEAMACGTPVASTDYSDVRHILPTEWQVVSSRVADEVADAVQRCYLNRARLAAEQRRWVDAQGSAKASAAALVAAYGSYVGRPTQSFQQA